MPNHRKDDLANEMYASYMAGFSIEDVGLEYGRSRQAVYEMFKTRGFVLRDKPARLPAIQFNGFNYTMRACGYYGKTNGSRSLLHRDVWEFHNGPIPRGFDIHHIDGNKLDNRPENLEIMSPVDHGRLHHLKYSLTKKCVICESEFTPHKTKRKRQQTCSEKCRLTLVGSKRRKLSQEQFNEIVRRRRAGEKLSVIAAAFGISQTRVSEIAKGKSVLSFQPPPLPPALGPSSTNESQND